jgi:tRNA/rRNA methyltransferase
VSGTDRSRADKVLTCSPTIILIEPQLGENIGMAARAMLNCGLTDLRLVRPREIWPNDKAVAAASGADRVLDGARLFASTGDAIADLHSVFATTARPRYMTKKITNARSAAAELRARAAAGEATGILFGKEAAGLHNDDIALAEAVITIPLNPAFSSLNLGMAVLLVSYEWFAASAKGAPAPELVMPPETRPANQAELLGFYQHLEAALDACGFLRNQQSRPSMVRNLRNLFGRARPTEQEVRTLRGVITCLVEARHARH